MNKNNKIHVNQLIKSQNSNIWQILDMPWYTRNFHIYKGLDDPRLNGFKHFKLKFHLALKNINKRTLHSQNMTTTIL